MQHATCMCDMLHTTHPYTPPPADYLSSPPPRPWFYVRYCQGESSVDFCVVLAVFRLNQKGPDFERRYLSSPAPSVIDSLCAMNNLLMLCAMQVRSQIDFMRVGGGVGGAYAYSAVMCSMSRVFATWALCFIPPPPPPPPPPPIICRTRSPCVLCTLL